MERIPEKLRRKVMSADDVEKVLDAIRAKLLAELENNDEVNLR